jgi:hypothetical protein
LAIILKKKIMSIIYFKNGRTAWNGVIAYHENGRTAWNGVIAYHENGRTAWNGVIAYHQNGRTAWNGVTAYYENGASAGNAGIEIQLGPDIKMYVGEIGFQISVLGNPVISKLK